MKLRTSLLILLSLSLAPLSALCWDQAAHQTVALIAQSRLTPDASRVVNRLLAQEPGSTLVSITAWADEHRDKSNIHWHYINFPRNNCHYQAARDCPDGECVVAQIDKLYTTLQSDAPDADKLIALKFLVHLVADIHQPLHAGFKNDKGGNLYQIQYRDQKKSLHALWDDDLVAQFHQSPQQLADTILSTHATEVEAINLDGGASAWAEQSCAIVKENGFYPRYKVTRNYLQHYAPVVQEQLLRSGIRLADLLNTLH